MTSSSPAASRAGSGVPGLDEILWGGFPRDHTYLVHGLPGTGKTTLGLQFAQEGARRGERVLYVTNCETPEQIESLSEVHGFSLDGVDVRYLESGDVLGEQSEQSLFESTEFAFPRTLASLSEMIEDVKPRRLVLDSLTELRLLAAEQRLFRKELHALTRQLTDVGCTALVFDDTSAEVSPLSSVVNGIIDLEQRPRDYGPDRRRIRVRKLRGINFSSGHHDYRITTGGLVVYPRLRSDDRGDVEPTGKLSSGLSSLDELLGGGVPRGSSTLLQGSTGGGKSTVAAQFAVSAAERGERTTFCLFDESRRTLLSRTRALGMAFEEQVEAGRIHLREVDPAELTPGEFSQSIRRDVEQDGIDLLVIDSLNGYEHAMTDDRLLLVHLHELLSFLGSRGVSTLMILAQHGGLGSSRATMEDLSYISDAVLLFRHFEFAGETRQCLAAYKNRGGAHERTIREMRLGPRGIRIGAPLRAFQGVLGGTPDYIGDRVHEIPDPEEGDGTDAR